MNETVSHLPWVLSVVKHQFRQFSNFPNLGLKYHLPRLQSPMCPPWLIISTDNSNSIFCFLCVGRILLLSPKLVLSNYFSWKLINAVNNAVNNSNTSTDSCPGDSLSGWQIIDIRLACIRYLVDMYQTSRWQITDIWVTDNAIYLGDR